MTAFDAIPLGPDGLLDMDRLAPEGAELPPGAEDSVRAAMAADPIPEPDPDDWADLVTTAVSEPADDDATAGPFAVDPDVDPAPGRSSVEGSRRADTEEADDPDASPDGDPRGLADALADDAPGGDETSDLATDPDLADDDGAALDLDLDVALDADDGLGGADLTGDDGGVFDLDPGL